MSRFPARERLGQRTPGSISDLRRKLVDCFDLALELEPVVLHTTSHDERRAAAVALINELAFSHDRIRTQ